MDSKLRKLYPWERKFGYYNIQWKIENFYLASFGENVVLQTPEFYISGPQLTKWMLVLHRKRIGDKNYIVFCLKRARSDKGPDVVWVQWRSWIQWFENDVEKHFFLNEHESRFRKNQICDSDKVVMSYFLQNLRGLKHDIFEIRCQLLVNPEYDFNISSNLRTQTSIGSLSTALSYLFRSGKGYDITIATDGEIVRAHKAILHYRNNVMAKMMETENTKGSVNLTNMNYEAVRSCIRYLYSGNVNAVLRRPRFAKKSLASLLNIREINGCYILDNLYLESKYMVDECSTDWVIENYSTGNQIIRSSPVIHKGLNFHCILHFCPPSVDLNSDYASVYFEVTSGERPRVISIEISILNDKIECIKTKKICTEFDILGVSVQNVARKDTILSALVNDSLLMRVKILSSNTCNWITCLSYDNDLKARIEVDCYAKLSLDMESMFEDCKYADITLTAENVSYRVHRFMLYARSSVLATMLDQDSITIPHMKPKILHILLYYIYTGVLKDHEFSELIEIYEYADVFGIRNLRKTCSKILKDSINMQLVFDVLKCSEDRRDKCLKHMALKFISQNMEQISEGPRWRQMVKNKIFLWKEIMMFEKEKIEKS